MTKCSEGMTQQTQDTVNEARVLAQQLIDTLDRLEDYLGPQNEEVARGD